jgi:hypothetical protein
MRTSLSMTALATLLLMACSPPVKTAVLSAPESTTMAADAFFARLHALCGKAYAGRLVAFTEADAASFGGTPVMHVRECSANEIRIPFHVGEDRSRTWVVTRTASGLRLKHDHRHVDGSSDALTMYGGDSRSAGDGTAQRQEFPADAESKALFAEGGLVASIDNVWAIEVEPGVAFAYELRRPKRHFRVEFDLSSAVVPPPSPWGH